MKQTFLVMIDDLLFAHLNQNLKIIHDGSCTDDCEVLHVDSFSFSQTDAMTLQRKPIFLSISKNNSAIML